MLCVACTIYTDRVQLNPTSAGVSITKTKVDQEKASFSGTSYNYYFVSTSKNLSFCFGLSKLFLFKEVRKAKPFFLSDLFLINKRSSFMVLIHVWVS